MSRELKFRVWNKKANSWVPGCGRHDESSLDGVHLFGETILLGAFMNDVSLEDLNDCVALQYTGIKDKNGKEIFEGDKIKYRGQVGIIEFFAGMFMCCWDDQTDTELGYMMVDDMEIVGNIFETPDLLK